MTAAPTVERLADRLLECLPDFSDDERRLALTLYRLLAEAEPVPRERLATALGVPTRDVVEMLGHDHLKSLLYSDNDQRIIGFGGLAVRTMPHALIVGDRRLHTWCAWDSLFIPPILGERAHVRSPCPVTGETVRLTVSPTAVETYNPPGAVMSFTMPDASAFEGDVQQTMASFCHFVYFFASRDAAETWTAERSGTLVITIADGFALGQRLTAARWNIGAISATP